MSPHLPWAPPNFTVTTFMEGFYCSDPAKAPADFFRILFASDVVVWTESSIPFTLGAGCTGIHEAYRR